MGRSGMPCWDFVTSRIPHSSSAGGEGARPAMNALTVEIWVGRATAYGRTPASMLIVAKLCAMGREGEVKRWLADVFVSASASSFQGCPCCVLTCDMALLRAAREAMVYVASARRGAMVVAVRLHPSGA